MTRHFGAAAGAAVAGLALGLCSLAAAAERSAPEALTDSQLDRSAAGGKALAEGAGQADGRKLAQTDVAVSSYVAGPSPGDGSNAIAVGQVTATAFAAPGGLATASSNLSLSASLS